MPALARLWRSHRVLVIVFVLAAVLTGAFATRTVIYWVRWSDPAIRTADIEGWMTPGYVARARGVPFEVVLAALGLDRSATRGQSLDRIAAGLGRPLDALIIEIDRAVAAFRAEHGR